MKNEKKLFYLMEAVLLLTVLLVGCVMIRDNTQKDRVKIALIVPDSNNGRWSGLKYGMKMAARDMKAEVVLVSVSDISSAGELERLIESEKAAGCKGVVIQELTDERKAVRPVTSGLPAVILGDGPRKTEGMSLAYTDFEKMSRAVLSEVEKDYGADLRGKKIGLVMEGRTAAVNHEAIEACRSALVKKGGLICWEADDIQEDAEPRRLYGEKKADIVIAFDDRSLLLAGAANTQHDLHGARVYGIGHSIKAIYYADSKAIDAVVVPDTPRLGYEALKMAAEKVRHRFVNEREAQAGFVVLRQRDLFSEENERLIDAMSK